MTTALLIEMAWKSGLVAAVALLGAALIRARPAAERVALLRLGVVLMLALPLLSMVMPALRVQPPVLVPPVESAPAPAGTVSAARRDGIPPALPSAAAAPARIAVRPVSAASWTVPAVRPDQILLAIYGLGVALLAVRLLAGVVVLARWTRQGRPIADPAWLDALERAAQGRRRPALLASSQVSSPLSWGWRPAVILLNEDILPHAERADAVLTHEIGHVRRADWPFLMLSRIAVALFWFNPLAWLLQRELARQSERAVDAWAVRHVGRADYASALVATAGGRRQPQAALGMAVPSSDLARRVAAVLAGSRRAGRPWPTAIAALACVGLATPLAALEFSAKPPAPDQKTDRRVLAPVPRVAPSRSMPVLAFAAAPAARPDDPMAAERLALVLRQRDQGLALMEEGARAMERRAGEMRDLAARSRLNANDRQDLIKGAAELDREAADLRADARELAGQDPATLRPFSPAEEREMFEGMRQVLAVTREPLPLVPASPDPSPVETDASGALRFANGVQREASGAISTLSGLRVEASGAIDTVAGLQVEASGEIQTVLDAVAGLADARRGAEDARLGMEERKRSVREGVREMRQGADEIEAAAAATEQSVPAGADPGLEAEIRGRAASLRRQAGDLRRKAGEIERGAP